ncbi:MAG: DUF4388 domain-containing protein [Myxococcota bacterium]|nr:DUF4388 domain-containing protein [Myxococcota bacterium]
MPREEAFLLFAPPEPPVRLEDGEEVVLGRSRECGLLLRSGQASRRHAAIRRGAGGVVLRDLGSTNGTFVNDVRVEGEQALSPGDRIQVGDAVVTLCRVEEGPGATPTTDSGEAQTMVFERPPGAAPSGGAEALAGALTQVPLFAVLQMLEMGGQTGVLEVHGPEGPGRLWLDRGRPVHAETEKAQGVDAALAIAQVTSGRFEFAPGEPGATRTLDLSVTELVLEASRLLDESAAHG